VSFWVDVPTDERVTLFSVSHISFVLTAIVIVTLFVLNLDKIKNHWSHLRYIFIAISSIQVIALYSWSVFELGFSLEAGLPIHLCRMSTLLGLYFLITKDKRVFHALYYMSAFALVAILYPVNVHPIYTHIIGWSYQISHIMIVLVWIVGVYLYGYRPTYKILNTAIVVFLLIELVVWRFNYWVGDGEYLYLRSDVNRPFFRDWHDLLWIAFTIVLSYAVMFFMTWIYNRKQPQTG